MNKKTIATGLMGGMLVVSAVPAVGLAATPASADNAVVAEDANQLVASACVKIANVMGEFARTKVVPEVDAIRFARLTENAGTTESAALTTAAAVESAILTAEECMQDNGEELSGCILYTTSHIKRLLREAQPYRMGQGESPNGNFSTFDDMRIKVVPTARFYSAIDLFDGKSTGEEAGGYRKAEAVYTKTEDASCVTGKTYYTKSGDVYTAVTTPADANISTYYELTSAAGIGINFMMLSPKAAAAITKHEKLRYFPPDVNQDDDAHKWQYRLFHDLLVYENRKQLIYAHLATL